MTLSDDVYLSLSAASKLLGVHSTTLRRWSDSGAVPVYMTPGGHRRFARVDINVLVERRPVGPQPLTVVWAQQALAQTRTDLARTQRGPAWLGQVPESEREDWRRIGQRLMGVVLRYVNSPTDDEEALAAARAIGADYARCALLAGMPLTTALEAALFFRDSLVESAMAIPDETHVRTEDHARLLRRISRVANVVQLAVAESYA